MAVSTPGTLHWSKRTAATDCRKQVRWLRWRARVDAVIALRAEQQASSFRYWRNVLPHVRGRAEARPSEIARFGLCPTPGGSYNLSVIRLLPGHDEGSGRIRPNNSAFNCQ